MKKLLTLLLALILLTGMAVPAFAADGDLQAEMVKSFSENAITLGVGGKDVTYAIDQTTQILLNDTLSTLAEAANKGVNATLKVSGNKATEINFSEIGEQHQGYMNVSVTYPRQMSTDTSFDAEYSPQTSTATKEEIGEEVDNGFVYRDSKTIDLGTLVLVPDSLKITLNGKDLKVIYDENTAFDKAVEGDEVKISYDTEDENQVLVNFEKDMTDNAAATQADIESILKVSYKKKIYELSVTELYKFIPDENVYVELNGKETTLPKAMNRSTYAYYILNPEGRIIYINSFYQDLSCVIEGIKGDTIEIAVDNEGRTPFKDTLQLSAALSINGGALNAADLKAKDAVKLTVDPYEGYKVISIVK